MEPVDIPARLFYKIGQVSDFTGVKPHVLRYWEAEFGLVKPRKDARGQRLYQRKDIDIILHIKELLYNQRYSIGGAKLKLKQELSVQENTNSAPDLKSVLDKQKKEIKGLLDLLNGK